MGRKRADMPIEASASAGHESLNAFSGSATKALRNLLLLGIFAPAIQLAYSLWIGKMQGVVVNQMMVLAILAACYRELHAGRVARGLKIFAWSVWGFACYTGVTIAGMHSPALMIVPCMTMVVAWSQGRRAAYLMMSASVAVLIGIVAGGRLGWLPAPILRTPEQILITYTITIVIVGIVAVIIADNMKHLIGQAQRASTQLQSMLDSATEVAIISMDLSGNITLFNPGAEYLLGYSAKEMLGQYIGKFVPEEDVRLRADDLTRTLGRTVTATREGIAAATIALGGTTRNATYLTKDARCLRVSVVTSVVTDEHGQPSGLLSIARDITAQLAAEANLLSLNLGLEARVRERTEELQRALDDLHAAKDKLVQSEKLASLGALVAAVAHELNTPIGICVSVSSTLESRVQTLQASIGRGVVKRSELDAFLQDSLNASTMLNRNLERSARLISSFRQVAADARSLNRRKLSLRMMMSEIIASLTLSLRDQPFRLDYAVENDGELDSFPEAIGNIIAQLMENSLTHAFQGRTSGTMRLTAELAGDEVTMRFSDDGCGMTEETCRRAFDPFFTTQLGQGTSGLGLYICYNLATGPLGGTIVVESAIGHGARFTLRLPRTAPSDA